MAKRKRRVLRRTLAGLLLAVVLFVVAMPLWLPWVLRPIAARSDLNYSRYERVGYGRFVLHDASFAAPSGHFTAERVEVSVPTAWIGRMLRQASDAYVRIDSWSFDYSPQTNRIEVPASSVYTNVHRLRETLSMLRRWMPVAELNDGALNLNGMSLGIPSFAWRNGTFRTTVVLSNQPRLAIQGSTQPGKPIQLSVQSTNFDATALVTQTTSSLALEGNATWLSNEVAFAAQFPIQGSIPETASVVAEEFRVPASLLRLQGYDEISGAARGEWSGGQFNVFVQAEGEPGAHGVRALPLQVEVRAGGTTNQAIIETLQVRAPGFEADLSRNVTVRFKPPYLPDPAELRVSANLTNQPWIAATGMLNGLVALTPADGPYPHARFQLAGDGVTFSNIQTESLRFEGECLWPEVRIDALEAAMADGSHAALHATVDLEEKSIERGNLDWFGPFGQEFLPEGVVYDAARATVEFNGAFNAIQHRGTAVVSNLNLPRVTPVEVSIEWDGRMKEVERAAIQWNANGALLNLTGAMRSQDQTNELQISEFRLRTADGDMLELQQPFLLAWNRSIEASNAWQVHLTEARFSGNQIELSAGGLIEWPTSGRVNLAASGLSPDLAKDFVQMPELNLLLERFVMNAGWTNGPLAFSIDAAAGFNPETNANFSASTRLSGGSEGLRLHELQVSSSEDVVCRADGELPLVIEPASLVLDAQTGENGAGQGTTRWLRVLENGPVRLHAFAITNSPFWTNLAQRVGARLTAPNIDVDIRGTWSDPEGHVVVSAGEVGLVDTNRTLPAVQNLDFLLDLDQREARARLSLNVEAQPLRANAEMPLGEGVWTALVQERRVPDWREVRAQIEISEAQVASFSRFIPEVLAPQGQFSANLRLEPGGRLSGELELTNAATRPLGTLGPVRDIHAQALFSNETVVLTNCIAEIGGQPLTLMGTGRVDHVLQRREGLPPFHLRLTGTNVPLVREANVLVRADMDLSVTNAAGTNAVIYGNVRLRDSFFLSSLQDLVPGRVASPERRPPYFSVDSPLVADWRLAIDVTGDEFLSVRTPLFRGRISTTLRIEGTFEEPVALGEARIASGAVTFPFGSLNVQQGFVSLTSDNPYRPELFVVATAQRLGYDVRMEVTGPADEPVAEFSSNPPLSSEHIVLMLTTGRAPAGVPNSTTLQRAQGLALFAGKNLLSEFGLGGAGEGRLTIRSGEQLTEAGRPTYEIEYRLTDDWSVVGEYDRFSQYNLGLKWNVYSR